MYCREKSIGGYGLLIVLLKVFIIALIASILAPILGIGGGSIFVPLMDMFSGYDIKEIIPVSSANASAIAIRSSSKYLSKGIVNLKLAVILVSLTIVGAFLGALVMIYTPRNILRGIFGVLLFYSSYKIFRRRKKTATVRYFEAQNRLFVDEYYDEAERTTIIYTPRNIKKGLPLFFVGGFASGLLGIGGGVVYVTVLLLLFGVPPRVAVAVSMFLICFSATTSAITYAARGMLNIYLAALAILGTYIGSTIGSKIALKLKNEQLRKIFAIFLVLVGIRMIVVSILG